MTVGSASYPAWCSNLTVKSVLWEDKARSGLVMAGGPASGHVKTLASLVAAMTCRFCSVLLQGRKRNFNFQQPESQFTPKWLFCPTSSGSKAHCDKWAWLPSRVLSRWPGVFSAHGLSLSEPPSLSDSACADGVAFVSAALGRSVSPSSFICLFVLVAKKIFATLTMFKCINSGH